MSEMISSMAKFKFDSLNPDYSFVVHYQGHDQRERENSPHGHLFFKKNKEASVSLDYPFDILEGYVPNHVGKSLLGYLRRNRVYMHFAWDMVTHQSHYASEYMGGQEFGGSEG